MFVPLHCVYQHPTRHISLTAVWGREPATAYCKQETVMTGYLRETGRMRLAHHVKTSFRDKASLIIFNRPTKNGKIKYKEKTKYLLCSQAISRRTKT